MGQNVATLGYYNCRDLCFTCVIPAKSQFRENSGPFHCDISVPCISRIAIMLQSLIIHFTLYCIASGRLWKVKKQKRISDLSSKSGGGRLREVLTYKRFKI